MRWNCQKANINLGSFTLLFYKRKRKMEEYIFFVLIAAGLITGFGIWMRNWSTKKVALYLGCLFAFVVICDIMIMTIRKEMIFFSISLFLVSMWLYFSFVLPVVGIIALMKLLERIFKSCKSPANIAGNKPGGN